MKTGIERIADERKRQIDVEGWTPEHDDQHDLCEIISVANCYTLSAMVCSFPDDLSEHIEAHLNGTKLPDIYPLNWDKCWWKPSKDPIRNLEKAGALIAAEIDRLQRLKSNNCELITGNLKNKPT